MSYTAANAFLGIAEYVKVDTVDIGGVGSEVSVNFDVESEDIKFGQSRTPITTLEKTKKYQVAFSMGEFTIANMALALGQPSANLTDDTYLLISSASADEVALEVKVKNEQKDVYNTLYFPKAKIAEAGTLGFNFESQAFMDITFDVFVHTGVNIGYITEVAV